MRRMKLESGEKLCHSSLLGYLIFKLTDIFLLLQFNGLHLMTGKMYKVTEY